MKIKKMTALVLSLLMLLSLFPLAVSAEEVPNPQLITDVSITGPEFVLGEAIPAKEAFSVPENADYSLVSCEIIPYCDTWSSEVFDAGYYVISCCLEPNEGYVFDVDENSSIVGTFNGKSVEYALSEDFAIIYCEVVAIADNVISDIALTAKEFKLNDAVPTVDDYSTAQDAHYSVTDVSLNIYSSVDYELKDYEETTFESNGVYCITVELTAEEGYFFNRGSRVMPIYINGEKAILGKTELSDNLSIIQFEYWLYILPAEKIISEIKLNLPEEPTAGDTIDDFALTVPNDADYYIQYFVYDYTNSTPESFEEGGKYYVIIYAIPKNGFAFDCSLSGGYQGTVTLNDKTIDVFLNNTAPFYLEMRYSFDINAEETVVSSVEIPQKPFFAVGKTVTASDIQLPEAAPYSVVDVLFVDSSSLFSVTGVPSEGTFYAVMVSLAPAEGYRFVQETKLKIDGFDKDLAYIVCDPEELGAYKTLVGLNCVEGGAVLMLVGVQANHMHKYEIQKTTAECLKSAATCVSPAVYYYTCECGKVSTESTFTYGEVDLTAHMDANEDGVCDICTNALNEEPAEESEPAGGNLLLLIIAFFVTVFTMLASFFAK